MNHKRHFSWSSLFKRSFTSEILIISHKPGPSSFILPKYFVLIFYFFLISASAGYINLSVYIFKHTTSPFFFKTQLFHNRLYVDYYILITKSIEHFFINSLCIPHQQKNARSKQRFTTIHQQFPEGSPLSCPTSGRISSCFGMRTDPIFEGTAFHKGIDIAAAEGTPVYCAADGVVVFCGFKPLLGNVVYVRHSQKNLITIYGHLRTCTIKKNALAHKGQQLGHVGSTGKSTGPHLHFEVRSCGIPINPIPKILPVDTLLD